jgi:hypothetical protein
MDAGGKLSLVQGLLYQVWGLLKWKFLYYTESFMGNIFSSHLGNLSQLSDAKTRSISPENFRGEKGKGGMCAHESAMKNGAEVIVPEF